MILFEITLFIFFLMLSALFSGAEAAFFSLNNSDIPPEKEYKKIITLLSKPRRLLITILTGNTTVNVFLASFAAFITADIAGEFDFNIPLILAIESVVLSIVIILVSEITPKILAIKNSKEFSRQVSTPIQLFSFIFYPIAALLYNLTHILSKLIPHKEELFDSEEELKTLAIVGEERGTLDPIEKEMIHSVFDFGETAVREIMVPRIDVVGFEQDNSLQEVIRVIRVSRLSKFPVYIESIDDIKGILYAKDVLAFINGKSLEGNILSICREPYFIPETKRIDDLLKDFQEKKVSVAVVVDEYGGTAGMVTLEDVVEEIVGEIWDEFDEESPLVKKIRKNSWIVNAKIPINDLEDELPITFSDEREYDTLGGFLLEQFGDIPKRGTEINHLGYNYRIQSISGNRIINVLIKKEKLSNE